MKLIFVFLITVKSEAAFRLLEPECYVFKDVPVPLLNRSHYVVKRKFVVWIRLLERT